jgi:RNA polymerase sigma-B factor
VHQADQVVGALGPEDLPVSGVVAEELAIDLLPANATLAQQLGHTPTRYELAVHLDTTEKDVSIAANAWQARHPDSLDATSATGEEEPRTLIDTIGSLDARFDQVTDRHTLRHPLVALPTRQRRIVAMRYFADMTQAEIATHIGVSQMQISRLLVRTLTQLRTIMLTEPGPRSTRQEPDEPTVRHG